MPNLGFSVEQSESNLTPTTPFFSFSATTAFTSTDGITYTTGSLPPNAGSLMAYGNSKYVTVPRNIGGTSIASYSTDGLNWTNANLPITVPSGLTFGAGVFLTITQSSPAASSTDGITWNLRTLPASISWQSVAFGSGVFAAVASLSTTAATSTNGTTWTTRTMPLNTAWSSITNGNNFFVALSNSTTAASSTDGITWALRTLPVNQANSATGLTYGNGKFFSLGPTSTSIYSTDGITWNLSTVPTSTNWSAAGFAQGYFFAVTATNTTAAISTDAITWSLRTLPISGSLGVIGTYINESSTNIAFSDLSKISGTTSNIQTQINSKATTTQTFYIGTAGITLNQTTGTITSLPGVTSVNGTSIPLNSSLFTKDFANLTNTTLSSIKNFNFTPNAFVAFGANQVISSTDGITWSSPIAISSTLLGGGYGQGKFIGFYAQNFATGVTFLSTDGVTWTAGTFPMGYNINTNIAYGNGVFVAPISTLLPIASSQNSMYSTDAVTWTIATMPTLGAWGLIAYGNGVFTAVLQAGTNNTTTTAAATSTNGITWAVRTLPKLAQWGALTYGNGIFSLLSIDGTTTAASSTNGITWTTRTLPNTGLGEQYYYSAYGNGIFFATNWSSTTTAITSTDGITWTLRTMPFAAGSGTVAYGNGNFAIPAYGSTSGLITTDGITWTTVTYPSSDYWILAPTATTGSINLQKYVGQPQQPITATTYTVIPSDRFLTFNTTAACTVTLPNPGSNTNREIFIKTVSAFAVNSASSNVQPLTTTTAGTAILTGTAGKYARLVSNGQVWVIMEAN